MEDVKQFIVSKIKELEGKENELKAVLDSISKEKEKLLEALQVLDKE